MDKRFAQDAAHLLGHAFQRDNVSAFHVLRFSQTSEHWLAVDQNGAAAARALRSASVFWRDNAALLAQDLKEMHAGFIGNAGRVSV